MNRRMLGLLVLILATSGLVAQDKKAETPKLPDGWKEVSNAKGKFKIFLPDQKLMEQKQVVPTAVGKIDMYLYGVDQGNRAYMVAYADYPAVVVQANVDDVLDGVVKGNLNAMKATKTAEEKVKVQGHPARLVTFTMGNTGGGKSLMIMAGSRLYQVMALDIGKQVDNADAYLKSFKIIEDKK